MYNFNLLPLEIIENIFLYLDGMDLIHFSQVSRQFYEASCSKWTNKMKSTINLDRLYEITYGTLNDFLTAKPRCQTITVLNINCVHWIPGSELRRCLSKLPSLERLYAIDTTLGLLESDCDLYKKLPKLKRLAVSTSDREVWDCSEFPTVTHLYLHTNSYISIPKTLEEFWLIESGITRIHVPTRVQTVRVRNVNKFTYLCVNRVDMVVNLPQSFRSYSNGKQRCWDKSLPDRNYMESFHFIVDVDLHWRKWLHSSSCLNSWPFSIKQTRELLLGESSLATIEFDELNFSNDTSFCKALHNNELVDVLLCPNVKSLKKLSLNYCFGTGNPKRKREEEDDDDGRTFFEKIAKHSPGIEELELWKCENPAMPSRDLSISFIKNFRHLRKLTLDNFPHSANPVHLIDIFKSCKRLTSFRIKSDRQNTNLHNMLFVALKETVSLKDLRYEHHGDIPIDRMFEELAQNQRLKLERFFVKCQSVNTFRQPPFKTYLRVNGQLKLVYVVVRQLTVAAVRRVNRSLNEFRKDPQKVIVVTRNELSVTSKANIPYFHIFEMVKFGSNVSVLDVYNGFMES